MSKPDNWWRCLIVGHKYGMRFLGADGVVSAEFNGACRRCGKPHPKGVRQVVVGQKPR